MTNWCAAVYYLPWQKPHPYHTDLSAWTMCEPTDIIHRAYFCESNTAFQAHVLFPLEVSAHFSAQLLLCLLLSLSSSWAETLALAVTRSLCYCYIPFPASPSVSWTCPSAKSPIHGNSFFESYGTLLKLPGEKSKSKKHAFAKAFHFPLNKSCCFMNAPWKVNN